MAEVSNVEDMQWQEVYATLIDRDASEPLGADDLEALGEAAWWLRRLPECTSTRERAVAAHVAEGNPRRAAVVALRLFYTFSVRGDGAIAGGWLRRAVRLLAGEPEGIEHGELATSAVSEPVSRCTAAAVTRTG